MSWSPALRPAAGNSAIVTYNDKQYVNTIQFTLYLYNIGKSLICPLAIITGHQVFKDKRNVILGIQSKHQHS